MNLNSLKSFLPALCLFIAGCAQDPKVEIPADTAGIVTIELKVDIPMAAVPTTGTRSLTEHEERILEYVDILLFEKDGENEKFAYRTHNTNNLTSDGGEYQSIQANFKVDDSKLYRIVLLANLRDEVDGALSTTLTGDAKEDVLKKITFEHTARWPSKDFGSNAYRALPMWGESQTTTLINKSTTPSSIGTIPLLRSLALLQVAVNIPDTANPGNVSNGKDIFEIDEIKIYNSHKEGYASPLASAEYSNKKVKYPSLVSQDRINASSMTYVMADINPYHENALYNTIYINEAVNAGKDMADAVYLIIKGYYTAPGAPKNTSTPTWYRIDFYDHSSEHPDSDRINILRNHSYLVNINYIGGPGEEDEETAKNTLPIQMRAEIVGWSEGETTDVAWNGKYMLGVSQSTFELNNYGHANCMFTVITNYPKGWKARVGQADTWIKLKAESSFTGINKQDPFYFNVDDNSNKPDREGYIVLTADNLELKVKVIQSNQEVTLEVVDFYNVPVTERIFYSPKPENAPMPAQLFIVRWTPADRQVFVSEEVLADKPFEFSVSNGIIHGEILTSGWRGYTIAPPDFTQEEIAQNPFLEKASRFHFTLGDAEPHATNITLRHLIYNLITEEDDDYPMDGGIHSFIVKSNTTWRATVKSDPSGVLSSAQPIITATGGNNKSGEPFQFRMGNSSNGSVSGAIAIITFTYDIENGGTRTRDVEIKVLPDNDALPTPRVGEPSNCYILKPSGEAVKIPIGQANADNKIRIQSGQSLDWKLVWTDHPNGIDKNNDGRSPVVKVELEGSGNDAVLTVYGGSEPGNAVIAVTNLNSSVPLWSWHIWVTDFEPDDSDTYSFRGFTFMDRNLGSLVDDNESFGFRDPNFWGLFYQWGRKDPFPQALSTTSNEFRPLYDKDGNRVNVEVVQFTPKSGSTNLDYSVNNPNHYISITQSVSDWYTSDWGLINPYLWWNGSNNAKTAYDPCPEGWRVPVSTNSESGSPWATLKDQGRTLKYHDDALVLESSVLGYWPLGGIINRNDTKNFMYVGQVGAYWSAYPSVGTMTSIASYWYGKAVEGRPGSSSAPHVEYTSATSRVSGCSVRCVKID